MYVHCSLILYFGVVFFLFHETPLTLNFWLKVNKEIASVTE